MRAQRQAASREPQAASSAGFGFRGTDDINGLSDSPWSDDQILDLSVERSANDVLHMTRMGFLVQDVLWKRTPFSCARDGMRLNYFESLQINLKNREVYANGKHTFTFAECGIDDGSANMAKAGEDAGKRSWNFEVFVVPLIDRGCTEGHLRLQARRRAAVVRTSSERQPWHHGRSAQRRRAGGASGD